MYRLVRFGNVSLDYYNQVDNVGSGDSPTHYIALPDGGAIDGFGNLQKHPGAVERVKTLRLRADTAEALSDLYFRLLALRGTRDRLVRRLVDGTEHWQYARLVSVQAKRDYNQTKFKSIQDIELRFVTGEITWRGAQTGGWYLNDGNLLNDGLFFNASAAYALIPDDNTNFVITVGNANDAGRAPVRSMRILVDAGNTPFAQVYIYPADESRSIQLELEEAFQLALVDTGALALTVNGEPNYSAGSFYNPDGNWFILQPGENQISVFLEGGGTGASVEFEFYEAWY